ncbi:zinc-alpha-2-glycoprotein [Mesocricetus auratus]|uniref:Zinc-alpha-2-glycoprotein n=1 Tax=Mesocricetus auratus TaxID=10036 RepID=A0A3Q0D9P7_MESAU|nr:zinc-alpha-2-glycoprotein [Mesocricetus auratus]XP_021089554.1 zinc-alpha-2-glycoprotein [Mesocricetus auratus]XP_040591460.1 zinc-alpha-2-glycoprotein [Mesocricetus auratus]
MVYLDNEPILHYAERRAEPRKHGVKEHDCALIWTRETEDFQEKEEQLSGMLAEVMTQKGQNGGVHTLQATFGCEIQGNHTGGFWRIGYDGQDFLSFDQKNSKWQVPVLLAHSTKTLLAIHSPSVDQVKTFLDDICPYHLWRYLTCMKNQIMDTVSPKLTVTNKTYPEGRSSLTCWASNLYSPVVTLVWLQHGKPVQQQIFGPGTILPSGDGTYQTWVSIWVLPGQEPEFTCHLRHRSNIIEAPAFLGHQARKTGGATSSASALVASALCTLLVFLPIA